jgi:transcriptional regulator with XRE-family HTH domain
MVHGRYLPFGEVLSSDVPGWPPDRALARQAYIALAKGGLNRRGWSQRDVAGALNTSEAFVSQLLTPLVVPLPSGLRTPPIAVAKDIARLVCDTPEQQRLFVELAAVAATNDSSATVHEHTRPLSGALLDAVLLDVRTLRETAKLAREPVTAQRAYFQLWETSNYALARISPSTHPIEFVEALMLLHDAACILNRADVALLCAQRATIVLREASEQQHLRSAVEQLTVKAARAEVVALNSLCNPDAARAVALHIEEHHQRAALNAEYGSKI